MRASLLGLLLAELALGSEPARLCESVERVLSMGTVFEIQMVAPCSPEFRSKVILGAKSRLDQIEASMSLYQSESEISRLNRGETLSPPSGDFRTVVAASLGHSRNTQGYFDITIWPALREIRKSVKETGKPPVDQGLARLRSLVDYRNIRLSPGSLSLSRPGAQVSTDGIAKGYAVDVVAEQLSAMGVSSFLMNFSGNMRVRGNHLDGRAWSVSIFNPVTRQALPARLSDNESIASSGVEYESYTPDRKWHHLISPKTLKPANHVVGSTIIGPSAMTCDALSTATFVMGPELTRKVLSRNYPQYRYWMIDAQQRVFTNLDDPGH